MIRGRRFLPVLAGVGVVALLSLGLPTAANAATTASAPTNTAATGTAPTSTAAAAANVVGCVVGAPTLTSIAPTSGPAAGGTVVTLTGTDLSAATEVTFGATPGTDFTVVSDTTATVVTPAGTAGATDVALISSEGDVILPAAFTYVAPPAPAPTITGVSPTTGPTAGGTTVTITGTGFDAETTVTIGGTAVPAVVLDSTSLFVTVPAHAPGVVDVTVTGATGTATLADAFVYTAPPTAPTITSLTPATGSTSGGTAVVISGTGFSPDSSVTFGGVGATVVAADATSISLIVPAHSAGAVDVTLTAAGGSATLANAYTFVAPTPTPTVVSMSPDSGSVVGGTVVTLTGANFVPGDTSVTIGGVTIASGDVTVTSGTSLIFTVPAHAAGNVTVTVSTDGGTSNGVPGGYTYVGVPTVSSLSPNAGPTGGGSDVTVTGTNFVPGATDVEIGGITVPSSDVTVNSATSLTFVTPAQPSGDVEVVVETIGGASSPAPGGYSYLGLPTASALTPNFGPVSGGTSVTITGTNFAAGNTSVVIGGTFIPSSAVTVNSATSLTFVTPAHAAGNVSVSVSTSGGSSAPVPGGFTFVSAPTTTALTPNAGVLAGGTTVTMTGTGFSPGNTSVTIGSTTIPAASVTVNSSTSLTFVTPAHAAGLVAVSVTTPGGTSNSVAGGYTYSNTGPAAFITGPARADGAARAGGTAPANSAAPAGGTVQLVAAVTRAAAPAAAAVCAPPTFSSVSPDSGPLAGGTTVTIRGSGFTGATAVTFGGTAGTDLVVVNDTTLTVVTPAGIAGDAAIGIVTPNGSVSDPAAFAFVAAEPPTSPTTPPVVTTGTGGTLAFTGSTTALIGLISGLGGIAAGLVLTIGATLRRRRRS